MGKGDANLGDEVHGVGLESIRAGFRELRMPEPRMPEAFRIVAEILVANSAVDFRWYKPPVTDELSCYWDDHDKNVLWVTVSEVHVVNDPAQVMRPPRSTTWQKDVGAYVGWLLPGAERGAGGGPRSTEIPTVVCPESFIRIPTGSICPHCDVTHE